uniref:Transmembrane protein 68 n=1 Tax=Pavo cristatus TaxID=9049 RepID=A0A8C9L3J3_PAVCR
MIGSNESSTEGPVSMSYLTFLAYLLGEWTGVEHAEDYLSYGVYLSWVLFPLAIVFILPVAIFFFCFNTSLLLLHIYKRRKSGLNGGHSGDVWYGAKEMLANLWDGHGRIWHGYELHGDENIPEGPALIVFYHGASPVDYLYFMARLLIRRKRYCHVVADHFVFRKDFSILVDNKVNMIIFVAKAQCKLNCVLAFFSLSVADRLKGVILSLGLAPVRAHPTVLCPVLYFPV